MTQIYTLRFPPVTFRAVGLVAAARREPAQPRCTSVSKELVVRYLLKKLSLRASGMRRKLCQALLASM